MQRASAAFGFLIFVLWLVVLGVGLAYVTVWAATQRRPQWRLFAWLSEKPPAPPTPPAPTPLREGGAEVIPFDRRAAERRRRA